MKNTHTAGTITGSAGSTNVRVLAEGAARVAVYQILTYDSALYRYAPQHCLVRNILIVETYPNARRRDKGPRDRETNERGKRERDRERDGGSRLNH